MQPSVEDKLKSGILYKVRQEKLKSRKVGIKSENDDCFQQRCLDPEDPLCTADEFFKEISYLIDLTEIYKIISTCYYNDEMNYVPIQLEIMVDKIRKTFNDSRYLLQIWTRDRQKIFEKPLKYPLRNWAIIYNYFILVLEDKEQGSEYLYIYDLDQKPHTFLKVQGFGLESDVRHLCYKRHKLYAVTRSEIRVISLMPENLKEDGPVYVVKPEVIRVLKPGCPLHDVLVNQWTMYDEDCLIVAFETPDNQVDFNNVYVYDVDDPSVFSWKYEQYRIVNPRKNHKGPDPIKKIAQAFYGGFNFCVSLRTSGLIDIYWNMARRDSPQNVYFQDVGMSIFAYYFKLEDGTYSYFKHKGQSNLAYSMSEPITEEEVDWENLHLKRINNYVKLFTSFRIASGFETFVMIGHGNFISVFNIEQWKWTRHHYFSKGEVRAIFRKNGSFDVLLSSGDLYKYFGHDLNEDPGDSSWKSERKIIRYSDDCVNTTSYTLVTKQDEDYYTKTIAMCMYSDGNDVKGVKYEGSYGDVIYVQNPRKENYVIFQKDSGFAVCKLTDYYYDLTLQRVKEFRGVYVEGCIHSAISYDLDDHIFVFTNKNIYVFRMDKTLSTQTYYGINCIGVKFFSKQVTYLLCRDEAEAQFSGLRLLDMESTLKKNSCNPLLLKNIEFGANNVFEYSSETNRLCFQSSLNKLIVTPLLHQNANKLLGADVNDTYICKKVVKDRLITLTKAGQLTTWNLVNGKHVCTYEKNEELNLNNSWNFQSGNDNLAIFYSDETVENKDEEFYEAWQKYTYADKQRSYLVRCGHYYRNWKVVEIKNESEVQVSMEFVFPYYQQYHSMFINEKKDRLILKIVNYRTFLYDIVKPATAGSNKVTFRLIRQIVDYPEQLEGGNVTGLPFFSPCFSRYLIVNFRTGEFIVKDAIEDKVVTIVPRDILSYDKRLHSAPIELIQRLKWLDYSTMLMINEEGVEKILNIDTNFSEVAYNQRPMFDQQEKDLIKSYFYFYKKSSLDQSDVVGRLKRIYQDYKMDFYLFKKKTFTDFYQTLLTVDPTDPYYYEHSFTFLHWSIIEQLMKKKIKVKMLEAQLLQELLYTILPGGNTIIHLLSTKEKQLMLIFEEAHKDDQIKFHVPFLPNIIGESPIHKCFENQDFKSIDTILKYLKHYPSDHHSRSIKDKYAVMVDQQLPAFFDYLDSRLQQTEWIKRFNKGCLKKNMSGIIVSELWFKDEDFFKEIIDKDQLETRMKCEFIDLPDVYHYLDKDFVDLFDKLALTTNEHFFEKRPIQLLIDFNYPLVRTFIISFLFVPFCLFHALYVIWANVIFEHRNDDEYYEKANLGIAIVLLTFSAYFLTNEVRQIFREGIEYIISVWNYFDLIAPVGVVFTQILVLLEHSGHEVNAVLFRCVFAITTFFMWIKLLYFLRIFKSTGYLIRMIVEVMTDMGIFLLVLIITLTAFGDAFLRLSLANQPDDQFITYSPAIIEVDPTLDPSIDININGDDGVQTIEQAARRLFFFAVAFTYRGILGDFDTSAFGRVATPLVWIFWTLHMLFNMIVMLNLLISIIGDTYSRVVNSQEQAAYQEMACLIAENQHLIPLSFKKSYAKQGGYLVQITNLESVKEDDDKDPVTSRLDELKETIEELKDKNKEMHKWLESVHRKLDKAYPEKEEEADAGDE